MIPLPAIGIQEGRCVCLYKGDFSAAREVAPTAFSSGILACGHMGGRLPEMRRYDKEAHCAYHP